MTTTDDWAAVDAYIADHLLRDDPALEAALAANTATGLPAIDVSPPQGKMLHLFARMAGARRILEVGTLGGYSTIWLARALPEDGILVTLELEPQHARSRAAMSIVPASARMSISAPVRRSTRWKR